VYYNKEKWLLFSARSTRLRLSSQSLRFVAFRILWVFPKAWADGAAYDVNKYTRNVLLLQGTTDKIVPLSMSENLYAHYNKHAKHCVMRVYEGEPHVFTGKYKVIAARAVYEFIEDQKA
jgi:dipeptidyl aminopeptidase/acylaminoacyl peptidase